MNKSEIWLPRVAAQKNGNNVCVKCLLVSKAKSFTFFVTGGCVTHRSARLLFIVVGVVYLKELLMCLNWKRNCTCRLYKWETCTSKGSRRFRSKAWDARKKQWHYVVYLKEMKSKGICQIQEELLCVLSKLNIPFLQGLLCCHVYTQTNKCLTFFSDEGTVCASGAYYFKKHKWRESPNPSGTDGLNILILEPHGEGQGLGNRMECW